MFIDTHTHLYLSDEFGTDSVSAVERALAAGVGYMIFPNVNYSTIDSMLNLHSLFEKQTTMAMGLHPTEITSEWKDEIEKIKNRISEPGVRAVGEIGIDLYWDKTFYREQADALSVQLNWAKERNLPIIIHCREGLDLFVEVFSEFRELAPKTVMHSFTGSATDVERLRAIGDFYFGIGGVVTFKNARELQKSIPAIGLDHIVLETDSPYLAPVPYRGKRNESAYLPAVANKIAELLQCDIKKVETVTTCNAIKLFDLPISTGL